MTPILASYLPPTDRGLLLLADRQRELRAAARAARPLPVRRRENFPVRALLTLALGVAVLMSMSLLNPAAGMEGDTFADASGVYQLESGEVLTLYGMHPMFELGGQQVHLVADGADRYIADTPPHDVISFRRDGHGAVTAVEFERPGEDRQTAVRIEPYDAREVTFTSDAVRLAGSLFLPTGEGPHPAVAIVHGAGPSTRETYRLMAISLARQGVGTLIYDKRGSGESTGNFPAATFDDLTDDALAAVEVLRTEARVDPDRVGLVGTSQGAWIIARAAVQSEDVAFVVAVSPSGFTPAVAADWLTGSMLAVRGADQHVIDASARLWGMMYSSLDLVENGVLEPMPSVPGFWFHALDPHLETVGLWEQVRQPVLALWGELDCQLPAHESLVALRGALERGPNRVHQLRLLADADHGLILAGPCEREIGFSHGGRQQYADGALTIPAEWIASLPGKSDEVTVVVPDERPPSALGWHQSTSAGVPWYGSLIPQAATLPLLLVVFGSLGGAWLAGGIAAAVRRNPRRRPTGSHLWGIASLSGLAATLLGTLALVELLSLGGVLSHPFIGGATISGSTVLYAAAGILASATIAFGTAAVITDARAGELGRPRSVVGVSAVVLLAAWAGYWGFLPLPSVG